MKTNLFILMSALLLTAGGFVACDESTETKADEPQEQPQEEEPQTGVSLPFTEYSLTGTSNLWTNLAFLEKSILVNSDEEFRQYVTGLDYPPIDFSKQTLLPHTQCFLMGQS